MKKEEIVAKMKSLGFPMGSYVIFGGAPLAVYGIREANDIDLLMSKELFAKLKLSGWQERYKNPDDIPIVHDVFEAHAHWNFSAYSPTLEHLLKTAVVVDGVPFASLEEVRKCKVLGERPKDLVDLKLIDEYLQK